MDNRDDYNFIPKKDFGEQVDELLNRLSKLKNEVKPNLDKGTIRNINNYRMKLWGEVLVQAIANWQTEPKPTEVADAALKEFDKRFNN